MIKVGLGVTVLKQGQRNGYIDGIGVYTKHLLEELNTTPVDVKEFAFFSPKSVHGHSEIALGKFSYQTIWSAVTKGSLWSAEEVDKRVDLFHSTDHYIPKLKKTPVVATIMDPITLSHPEWVAGKGRKIKNYLFRSSAQWAQQIITISAYSAEAIAYHFGIPESRITVIPLGVEECCHQKISDEKIKRVLEYYQLPEKCFINIGTIQPRKNIARLIAAHNLLPLEIQEKHPLVIIGRNGWNSDQLVKKLQQNAYGKYVRWINYISIEDKYALLQSSLALVFPSLYEGFGLPILEAFASNTPVISSNVTAIPEVVGDAGVLINPYSEQEIANAMHSMATNSALRRELKQKGRERVKLYSWRNTAKKTQDVYSSL